MAQGEWENHKYVSKKWVNGQWVYDYGDGTYGSQRTFKRPDGTKMQVTSQYDNAEARDASLRGYAQRQARLKAEKKESRRLAAATRGKRIAQKFDLPNKYDKTTGRKWRKLAKNAQGRLKLVKKRLDSLTAESRERVLKAYKKIKNKTRGFRNAVRKGYMKATLPVRSTARKAFNDATRGLRTGEVGSRIGATYRKAKTAAKVMPLKKKHLETMSPRRREIYEKHLEKKKNKNKGG